GPLPMTRMATSRRGVLPSIRSRTANTNTFALPLRNSAASRCLWRSIRFTDILLQQMVNGLALGMMYALLALGFTMVYEIIELINFAHFSVFMTGTFIGLTILNLLGVTAVSAS